MIFDIHHNGLLYQSIDLETMLSLVGDTEAANMVRQELIKQVKVASANELAKFDWMYIREYRMANTNTPAPVPAHIVAHYDVVRNWVDQQEQAIATITAQAGVDYVFNVPKL
jgi:hypothetical protein